MVSVEDIEGFKGSPHYKVLARIIDGETAVSSAGFPLISKESFQAWMTNIPHLFAQGAALLDWLHAVEKAVLQKSQSASGSFDSWLRAIKVLETVTQTVAVTAPSDLWLMKHILTSHQRAGVLEQLIAGPVCLEDLRSSKGLNGQQLRFDFHFLKSRGVVTDGDKAQSYKLTSYPQIQSLIRSFAALDPAVPVNMLPLLTRCFRRERINAEGRGQLTAFLTLPDGLGAAPNWIPGGLEVELGYRLVPILLAWRNSSYFVANPDKVIPEDMTFAEPINSCLQKAGIVGADSKPTDLGRRVLERAPGPFGIIHAYHEYMKHHDSLLHSRTGQSWVSRAENVAASQDANRKAFMMMNRSIDRFISRHDFKLRVFIEHAVGRGEATRQRFSCTDSESIQFFGADLEDAAIDQAIAAQKRGELPATMRFVRKADIGDPRYLIDRLEAWGIVIKGSVMVVGNGFHEIRAQTNEKMISVFKGYNEAGIVLIFTEESALSDDDLLHTGWNTYHAGFRYVHELSGQGLRPAYECDKETDRLSWKACLERAGYWVHPGLTTQTRRIYPVPGANGNNPAISVNYFCIPSYLASKVRGQENG